MERLPDYKWGELRGQPPSAELFARQWRHYELHRLRMRLASAHAARGDLENAYALLAQTEGELERIHMRGGIAEALAALDSDTARILAEENARAVTAFVAIRPAGNCYFDPLRLALVEAYLEIGQLEAAEAEHAQMQELSLTLCAGAAIAAARGDLLAFTTTMSERAAAIPAERSTLDDFMQTLMTEDDPSMPTEPLSSPQEFRNIGLPALTMYLLQKGHRTEAAMLLPHLDDATNRARALIADLPARISAGEDEAAIDTAVQAIALISARHGNAAMQQEYSHLIQTLANLVAQPE